MLEVLIIVVLVFLAADWLVGFAHGRGWLGADDDGVWNAGRESPVGKVVTVTAAFGSSGQAPEGAVELNGTRWNARATCESGFGEGDKARVEEIEGLTLVVSPLDEARDRLS